MFLSQPSLESPHTQDRELGRDILAQDEDTDSHRYTTRMALGANFGLRGR